jgi:hypothetical protein
VRNGDFLFAVCIVDNIRTILNVVPFRYRVDQCGKWIAHNFDDLNEHEIARFDVLTKKEDLSTGELNEYSYLQERKWLGTLPSKDAAEALLREMLPFQVGPSLQILRFLAALGIDVPTAGASLPPELAH